MNTLDDTGCLTRNAYGKVTCPFCQSVVSRINLSTQRKTLKCRQLQNGRASVQYRHRVQTVRIFDGVNEEPTIVQYEVYTYGPYESDMVDF